jgi:hypothetical protein
MGLFNFVGGFYLGSAIKFHIGLTELNLSSNLLESRIIFTNFGFVQG